MRQTCCPPCGFGIASHAGSLQVAVSPCWAQALPVVISANPSLRVWTPTPAAPRVHVPVTSPRTLAFPGETAGRRVAKSPTATSVGGNITELQSFTDVQTHKFARHTGSSHPCVLRRRAAVAFTSAPIRARYLPLQRICFPSKTGQLTEGGLPPPKIGSLDGCSASRVARAFLVYVLSPLPRHSHWRHCLAHPSSDVSLPRKGRRVGLCIVLFEAYSAFTRVTARTLALPPIRGTLTRRLQTFRHLHACSGCFRLERLPGGACTRWKAPPLHGAHPCATLVAPNSPPSIRHPNRRRPSAVGNDDEPRKFEAH